MDPLNPSNMPAPFSKYSHGVAVPAGCRFVFTSGQLGIDQAGATAADALEQARQCFRNCAEILAAGGMIARDVVRINAFVTDRAYMQARDKSCADVACLPASTLVIVSGFTKAIFKVEVELTAAAI